MNLSTHIGRFQIYDHENELTFMPKVNKRVPSKIRTTKSRAAHFESIYL